MPSGNMGRPRTCFRPHERIGQLRNWPRRWAEPRQHRTFRDKIRGKFAFHRRKPFVIQWRMIQRWTWLLMLCLCASGVRAATYELAGGATLTGEPISANAQGLVVKREDGSFAPRVPWTNFTQNALKQLAQDPKAKQFVDPMLEGEEEIASRKAAQEITVKPVTRLERPDMRGGGAALFRSPISVTLLILVYLANLYAGFEVAIFRNYPIGVGIAIAAVAPIVGPAIFLCLPRRMAVTREEQGEQLAAEHQAEHVVMPEQEAVEGGAPPPPVPSGPVLPQPIIYQRGHFSFNRRFFETKMPGFLRMVPSESEMDMLI